LAAKLSDAIAEEYIRQLEQAKKGSARSAGSWLGRTIETLRERVSIAEGKVETFRNQNGLFLVGGTGDTSNISSQQLSELNTQLATARSLQAELTSKARMIREAVRQGRIFEVSDVVNNESVRRLIESRATLKAQIAQEERTLLPQHPRIKELYAQLGGLEEQVRNAAERTSRALENDARAAGGRVAASQAELDQQKRQSGTSNEQEVQLRALEREAKAEREQLETYLTRYRDATSRDADNAVTADARVVSSAIMPTNPSFPKKLPIILIATLTALAISMFWILTKALLSEHVYARRLPEPQSQQPVMAYPPMMMTPQMMAMMAQGMMQQPVAAQAPSPQQKDVEIPVVAVATATPAQIAPTEPVPAVPVLSEASLAMQASLDRMGQVLKPSPAVETPAWPAAPRMMPAAIDIPEMQAPPMQPRESDIAKPLPAKSPEPQYGLTWMKVDQNQDFSPLELAADASDNPLFEIAEEAEAALIRGRPVSILVLSVESAVHAAATVRTLESILKRRGPSVMAMLDPVQITPGELAATAKSLAGNHDYVVFNGGAANSLAAALSGSTTLTVLVATDNSGTEHLDAAEAALEGCSYFIVGESSAIELERV
jgi:polysaccharide biosynthesis transport protein